MTVPINSEPAGMAVAPEMTTDFATDPLTRSSTLLVFDASVLRIFTLISVPAGIVTSRNFGAGGGSGAGGGGGGSAAVVAGLASDLAGGGAAGGVAGWSDCDDGGAAGVADCGAGCSAGAAAGCAGCGSVCAAGDAAGVAAGVPPAADSGGVDCEQAAMNPAASNNATNLFISPSCGEVITVHRT